MSKGVDLSIPNAFNSKNPSFFNAKNPRVSYPIYDDFTGKISSGGTCNVPSVNLDIHCTGTHTECIGHIKDSNVFINEVCPKELIPSTLITINPDMAKKCNDDYHIAFNKKDLLISKRSLINAIYDKDEYLDSIIIRTLPNNLEKMTRNYSEYPAPFFSNNAIQYLIDLGVKHLLVDVPSIDKANDDGQLGNHHLFFKQGQTISELLYIDEKLKDGKGFLYINTPNWKLDAVPSRPVFYPIS